MNPLTSAISQSPKQAWEETGVDTRWADEESEACRGSALLMVTEGQSQACSPCPYTATCGCRVASEGWRASVLVPREIQAALQLFPVHRTPENSIPASWLPPTYTSAHTICPAELFSLEELGNRTFPNSRKASKSRILPMASEASWPVSTSLASSLSHSPLLSALFARRAGLISASPASRTLSLLPAGSARALPFAWKPLSTPFF